MQKVGNVILQALFIQGFESKKWVEAFKMIPDCIELFIGCFRPNVLLSIFFDKFAEATKEGIGWCSTMVVRSPGFLVKKFLWQL